MDWVWQIILQSISSSDRHPYYSPAYINGILQRKGDTMNKSLADMQGFPAGFQASRAFHDSIILLSLPFTSKAISHLEATDTDSRSARHIAR